MKCSFVYYVSIIILCLLLASLVKPKNLTFNNKCCRITRMVCTSLLPLTIMSTFPFQGNIAYAIEDYRATINRDYIFEIKSALDQVAQGITSDSITNELYEDIDKITTKAQMTTF